MGSSETSAPRRGRPSVLDRAAIAAATFQLWAEHGYDAVAWGDIAQATGISTRTLVRHFSNKSDIAWVGVPAATRRLRGALAATPETEPVDEAARHAIVASIADDPMRPAGIDWIRVVGTEPQLAGSAPSAYQPWIDELARFLQIRVPGLASATATAIASGYQAATFAALVAWANGHTRAGADTAADDVLQWLTISAEKH